MSIGRLLRSRIARLTLALSLIAISGWAFLPYVLYRVAPSAFINATLIRVTSPISGRLADKLPRKGDFPDYRTPVTLVEALSPGQGPLLDLERQRMLAERASELAGRQLSEIKALDLTLSARVTAYHTAAVARLEREVAGVTAERQGCLAELKQLREAGSIMQALTKSGYSSELRFVDALGRREALSTRCEMTDARLSRVDVELTAARSGVFLGDGVNDVPYSQQQRERLVLRRQELETELLKESLQSSQLAAAIEAERDRMNRLASYRMQFPAGYVIWSTDASPGSAVTEGQTILHLADCERRFLAVELPARDFEQIDIGDTAMVRLIGDETWRQSWVQQVRGSAARTDDRLLAAQFPTVSPTNITVELRLPPDAFPIAGSTYCGIGRLAEVRFKRVPFGIVDRLTKTWRRMTELNAVSDLKIPANH